MQFIMVTCSRIDPGLLLEIADAQDVQLLCDHVGQTKLFV